MNTTHYVTFFLTYVYAYTLFSFSYGVGGLVFARGGSSYRTAFDLILISYHTVLITVPVTSPLSEFSLLLQVR